MAKHDDYVSRPK